MKAKTKDQLRSELVVTEAALNAIKAKTMSIFAAFTIAAQEALTHNPEDYQVLAKLVMLFFAKLEAVKAYDFVKPKLLNDEFLEKICFEVGFDEVTSVVIKDNLQVYLIISRMTEEGKTDEEIIKALQQRKGLSGK